MDVNTIEQDKMTIRIHFKLSYSVNNTMGHLNFVLYADLGRTG
jgi:hypothetical protein